MFSVRRIIGDDWGSTSRSKWVRERASLEIDYTAYGLPDAIVGLLTDPWVDLAYDGVSNFADYQAFLNLFSAQDPKADRNADTVFNFYDVQFFLADQSAAGADLTPTGRLNEEENPFGLDGYRYDAITGLYHVRRRVLDPEQGKWMQRDPAGFVDGGNVYSFAGVAPVIIEDPMGLWIVRRNHRPTATATTEDQGARGLTDSYDTILELAYSLGLEPKEFRQWISAHPEPVKVVGAGDRSWSEITGRESLCPNQAFEVPNQILRFIATGGPRLDHFGQMIQLGFYVREISKENRTGVLHAYLESSQKGYLFGIYMDVHSDGNAFWENRISKSNPIYFGQLQTTLSYRISVAYWAACNVGNCEQGPGLAYVEPAPLVLMSSDYRDYFPDDVMGTFIPGPSDDRDRIRDWWVDPKRIRP